MEQVNVKINGISYEVPADSTILEAARYAGVDIPTLCYLKDVNQIGACRMCMVEVKGAKSLVAACVYPVNEGMEVFTNTPKVQESRKMTLELLLSVHDKKCLSCERSGNCEFQKLCNDMGIEEENRFEGAVPAGNKDFSTLYLERNNAKCVLCRRCVAACQNQHVSVIGCSVLPLRQILCKDFLLIIIQIYLVQLSASKYIEHLPLMTVVHHLPQLVFCDGKRFVAWNKCLFLHRIFVDVKIIHVNTDFPLVLSPVHISINCKCRTAVVVHTDDPYFMLIIPAANVMSFFICKAEHQ